MKKWYYIYNLNRSEKDLIIGFCHIEQIVVEVSGDYDAYNLSVYLDRRQHDKLQAYLNIIFI